MYNDLIKYAIKGLVNGVSVVYVFIHSTHCTNDNKTYKQLEGPQRCTATDLSNRHQHSSKTNVRFVSLYRSLRQESTVNTIRQIVLCILRIPLPLILPQSQ